MGHNGQEIDAGLNAHAGKTSIQEKISVDRSE